MQVLARESLYPLIIEAKAGSPEAMNQLLLAVRPLLEKLASQYADPSCAAQSTSDLVQEAWLRTWLKLDQFSSLDTEDVAGSRFLAWVEKVARSVGLNAVRDRKALRRSPSGQMLRIDGTDSEGAAPGLVANTPSPSARLHEEDRSRLLRAAIDRLEDETDRVILRMRLFERLTLKRVAQRLDLDYERVKSRYRASAQKIERQLHGFL